MSIVALSTPAREAPRYLVAGALNTAASWLVYVGLLQLVSYRVAYTVSFAFGVLLSFLLNSWFVFGVPLLWRRLLPYPAVYLAQYAVGFVVVWLAVEKLGLSAWSGPLVALAFTLPLGFLLTRRVLVGRAPAPRDGVAS
jgi:putative flippase GtrA